MKQMKNIILSALMLLTATIGHAQEYQVKDFQLAANDYSANDNAVKDLNGNACALVKLLANDKVQKVEGNIIGQPQRKGSYTWLYLTNDTRRIDLHFSQHLSLSVTFADYGIKSIKGGNTYILSLEEKGGTHIVERTDTTDADVQYEMAKDYLEGRNGQTRNYDKAFYWLKKSAAQNNPKGVNALGSCYCFGYGTAKDQQKANEFFQRAMSMGNAKAYYNMGNQYINARGVERNNQKAAECYRKGAELGDAGSMAYLGWCYQNGVGVEKDVNTAVKWYETAADKGNNFAHNNVGHYYLAQSV